MERRNFITSLLGVITAPFVVTKLIPNSGVITFPVKYGSVMTSLDYEGYTVHMAELYTNNPSSSVKIDGISEVNHWHDASRYLTTSK
jgi:hypothetical protein